MLSVKVNLRFKIFDLVFEWWYPRTTRRGGAPLFPAGPSVFTGIPRDTSPAFRASGFIYIFLYFLNIFHFIIHLFRL